MRTIAADEQGETFEKLIHNPTFDLTVIDFYAPWCGPCKKIAPDFERLGSVYGVVDGEKKYGITKETSEEEDHAPLANSTKSSSGLKSTTLPCQFLKVDITECEDLAEDYDIEGLPTFCFFRSGKRLKTYQGADGKELEKILKELLVSEKAIATFVSNGSNSKQRRHENDNDMRESKKKRVEKQDKDL